MKKSVWLVALIGSLVVMLLAAAALVSQPALAGEAQLQSADSGGQFAAAPVVNDTVKYSVIPLGYLDGQQGGSSFGADVNLQGQVVGMSSGADRVNHGFIWHNGVMTDLGTLGDYPTVVAGVNDLGQVVGLSVNSNDEQRSFLWEAGQMQDLGTLSGFPILAHDINNNGQVVGSVNRSSANLNGVGFMWQDGSIEALAPGADDEAAAFAVNDEGQASGYLNYYNQLSDRRLVEPAVWDGGWSQLGNLAGSNPGFFAQGYAYAINDAGLVVGASQNSLGEMHAFLSEEGGMLDLGTLGGDFSLANDVNNLGQVVGFSRLADGRQHAFIAQDFDGDGQVGPGEMRDLNDLIPPEAQIEVIMAHGINDAGEIAATGIVDGQQQALLLQPVGLCEPTNLGGDENAGQDITIDFIEVSQGIQSVDNEMPLVQFRQTMVRVHLFLVEDNPSPGVVVSGQLRAFQEGIELLGSPLSPVDGVALARDDGGEREKLAHTLNFELPPTWLTKELLLCAEVNHKQKAAETNYENNVLETKVSFETGQSLNVNFVPLHLHKDGDTSNPAKVYTLQDPDAGRIVAHLYRYHPVAGVRIWQAPTLYPLGYPIFDQQWDLSKKADGIRMLNRITLYNLLTVDEAANLIYSGMVHPDVDPGPFLGLARLGKTESWSTMSSSSGSHPTWHSEGGWVLAHE
ncbi:MAG: hypothetical protein R3300_20455, partial [Candidatus Promineifilaceae bacterium]|nr:hypothetical protein [Candidatus Promineifilaceae bacterium]